MPLMPGVSVISDAIVGDGVALGEGVAGVTLAGEGDVVPCFGLTVIATTSPPGSWPETDRDDEPRGTGCHQEPTS